MNTLEKQIDKKKDELIEFYELLFDGDTSQHIYEAKIKKELSALKAQAEQESNNRQQSEGSANNLKTAEEILYERGLITRSINDEDDMKVHCDFEHIVEAMQEYAAQFKAEQEKVTDELVFKWLKDRKYQTSYGEQEYKMYFDVDMPKIIREAINHFTIEKVTDEDIDYFMCEVIFSQFDSYWDAMKYGAKAMRDGLITHTK